MAETTADLNAWKITAWVEIFYYLAVAILAGHLLYKAYHHRYSFLPMFIFLGILVTAKIVAGSCCVALLSSDLSNPNINLAIVYIILNTIAVGFFLRMLLIGLKFIDAMHTDQYTPENVEDGLNDDDKEGDEEFGDDVPRPPKVYESKFKGQAGGPITLIAKLGFDSYAFFQNQVHHVTQEDKRIARECQQNVVNHGKPATPSIYAVPLLDKIVGPFVIVSVVLCGLGGGLASSNDYTKGKRILEVGTVFYLISLITIFLMYCYKYKVYRETADRKYDIGIILVLFMITIPLVAVRIIYSILSAFNFNSYFGSGVSKYSQLYGDWRIYVGMAFVEECVAIVLILVTLEIALHKMK